MNSGLTCRASVLVLAAVLAAPATAAAQSEADTSAIEEVVVTAQRREQSLQSVPVSVTALTSAALDAQNVTSTDQLAQLAPGLVMTQQNLALTPYIRGVGTQNGAVGIEGGVALYVDGVYIPSANGSIFAFNNIERVEVLRGPQGTLFGRNVTGGLIQVITRRPQHEPMARIRGSYGNYETVSGDFYGSIGLGERVAIDLAAYGSHQGEGYGRNVLTGDEINLRREATIRSKLLFEATDDLTVTLSIDYNTMENDMGGNRTPFPGTLLGGGYVFPGGPHDSAYDYPSEGKAKQGGVSAHVRYDFGWATFSSLTAARKAKFDQLYDNDASPAPITGVIAAGSTRTFQQEFLLQGGADRFRWTAGAFFYDAKADYHPLATVSPIALAANFSRFATGDTNSWAIFGEGSFDITSRTTLTAGIRYTEDQLDMVGRYISLVGHPSGPGAVLLTADREAEFDATTWRVSLDHRFTDDLMVYGSASRGFKSGTFNLTNIGQDAIDPEVLRAYEVGVKADLLDNRLRVNASMFRYDYDDIQLTRATPAGQQTLNAAKARVKGAEVEATAVPELPVGRLELTASLALLDAEYRAFPNAPIVLPAPAVCTPTPTVTGPPTTGATVLCFGDASGNRMIRSPKWTLGLRGSYRVDLADGELSLDADYFYNDGFFWEPSSRVRQKAYEVVNAQVSYRPGDGPWLFRMFARNLFDELYYSSGSEQTAGDLMTAAAPRTYGVGFEYRFGGR